MQQHQRILEIAALGRSFRLGEAYDVREDRATGSILFNDQTISQCTRTVAQPFVDWKYARSSSIEDVASSLDVSASLKLSVLGGLVSVSGSGRYLQESHNKKQTESVHLVFHKRTRTDYLLHTEDPVAQGVLENAFLHDIQHQMATHVVTKIEYGGTCILSLTMENSSDDQGKRVLGNLGAEVQLIFGKISGAASLDLKDNAFFERNNINVSIKGDIPMEKAPTTVVDAVNFIQEASNKMGDGVPIKVTLHPLTRFSNTAASVSYELSDGLMREVVSLFQRMRDLKGEWDDLQHGVGKQRDRFCEFYHQLVGDQDAYLRFNSEFVARFQQLLVCFRKEGRDRELQALSSLFADTKTGYAENRNTYEKAETHWRSIMCFLDEARERYGLDLAAPANVQRLQRSGRSLLLLLFSIPSMSDFRSLNKALVALREIRNWRQETESGSDNATEFFLFHADRQTATACALPDYCTNPTTVQLVHWNGDKWSTMNASVDASQGDGWAYLSERDGRTYVGELRWFKAHGLGKMTDHTGAQHVGQWRDGLKHGPGTARPAASAGGAAITTGVWRDDTLDPKLKPLGIVWYDLADKPLGREILHVKPTDTLYHLVTVEIPKVCGWDLHQRFELQLPNGKPVQNWRSNEAFGPNSREMARLFQSPLSTWNLASGENQIKAFWKKKN